MVLKTVHCVAAFVSGRLQGGQNEQIKPHANRETRQWGVSSPLLKNIILEVAMPLRPVG